MRNTKPNRKNRSDGNATKEHILKTARTLSLARGYDAVTSKDICEAAQTNIAAVNYHFGSREGLLKEVEKQGHIPTYQELLAQNRQLHKQNEILQGGEMM